MRQRPKQLLELVVGLQSSRLLPLPPNVTSIDQMVMYSTLKVEDDCRHTSVDEIATAAHQMLGRIQERRPICRLSVLFLQYGKGC
ncbi:Helix-loop-helix DNA-binding domain [Musa troglodytarum]|uniref:Helix-loop-helix DNA-binding domain n=1 Tax=Musa troglodytarum TaxID=320322 RepID=A0A9E7IEM8_9LILI|nr:Helix-loop-helix DNA-binding domain [Musa troglodytarum]